LGRCRARRGFALGAKAFVTQLPEMLYAALLLPSSQARPRR
jgi:hypothetical protein